MAQCFTEKTFFNYIERIFRINSYKHKADVLVFPEDISFCLAWVKESLPIKQNSFKSFLEKLSDIFLSKIKLDKMGKWLAQNKGLVECKGNVTALLELGAGFNSELTGIENIYYLGAIQGVSKTEMQKKIDEILTFAELGDYAWQPVKNYSSGMYVRLAFSLSIHIDPEVLIIDEALSVGDVRFQQKCFRKIRQFKEQGKTIIFCSHSMQAVRDFCTKVIWIHDGVIQEIHI